MRDDPPRTANLPIGVPPGNDDPQKEPIDRPSQSPRAPPTDANSEIGGPGPGWHGRGYLPHFDAAGLAQHVTFRQADSLPREILERFEQELRKLPPHRQDGERRRRIEAWIDAGHGSCVLRDPAIAAMVQNALQHFHGERYRLLAWVIMPNHVHVLLQPLHGWTVAKTVASWKKFTATQISRILRTANLPIGVFPQNHGVVPNPIWFREYWDRYIRNEQHFYEVVAYIHRNPVKAGLVVRAEQWRWSSASAENAGWGGGRG